MKRPGQKAAAASGGDGLRGGDGKANGGARDLDSLFAKLTSGTTNGHGLPTNDSISRGTKWTDVLRAKSPFSGLPTDIDAVIKAPGSRSTSVTSTDVKGTSLSLKDMLADLNQRGRRSPTKATSVFSGDLSCKEMLDDITRTRHATPASGLEEAYALDELRERIANLRVPPAPDHPGTLVQTAVAIPELIVPDSADTFTASSHKVADLGDEHLEPEVIEYVLATILEKEGLPWETLLDTMNSVFVPMPNRFRVHEDASVYVEKFEADLDRIIQDAEAQEAKYRVQEEKNRQLCRIIVTNVAADATEEDLKWAFHQFWFDVNNITILEERHPYNRTKAAYIDFADRKTAWEASRVVDSIFGLKFRVRLAVDMDMAQTIEMLKQAAEGKVVKSRPFMTFTKSIKELEREKAGWF